MEITSFRNSQAKRILPCLCLALAPCLSAHAYNFCVTDEAGFQAALTAASDGGAYNNEFNSIVLAAGFYSTHNNGDQPFTYSSTAPYDTYVQGGASINCATFTPNPTATVLSGHNHNPVIVAHASNGTAFLLVSEVTIQDGESTQDGGGISVNASPTDEGGVTLSFSIVQNNHTTAKGGGVFLASGMNNGVSLWNTVIINNSADIDFGAGELVARDTNSLVFMASDDVVKNTSSTAGATGAMYLGGLGNLNVNLSIFAHNKNVDLYFANAKGTLSYVDAGMLGGNAPSSAIGFVQDDPMFVDYNATVPDLHLMSGSPLLAAAPYSGFLEPYDIEGHRIPTSGKVDYGAYEDTVFADGFDGD
jgi:hypothetical protein